MLNAQDMAGAVLLGTNALLRVYAPSAFVPAAQELPGLAASPVTARILATFAELAFYKVESRAFGLSQQWSRYLWKLWLCGEVLSWLSLVLQSQLCAFCEDLVWAIFQTLVFLQSTSPYRWVPGLLAGYYFLVHLPRVATEVDLSFSLLRTVPVQEIDATTRSWLAPSVIAQFFAYVALLAIDPQRP